MSERRTPEALPGTCGATDSDGRTCLAIAGHEGAHSAWEIGPAPVTASASMRPDYTKAASALVTKVQTSNMTAEEDVETFLQALDEAFDAGRGSASPQPEYRADEYKQALEAIAMTKGISKKVYNIAADTLCWVRSFSTEPDEEATPCASTDVSVTEGPTTCLKCGDDESRHQLGQCPGPPYPGYPKTSRHNPLRTSEAPSDNFMMRHIGCSQWSNTAGKRVISQHAPNCEWPQESLEGGFRGAPRSGDVPSGLIPFDAMCALDRLFTQAMGLHLAGREESLTRADRDLVERALESRRESASSKNEPTGGVHAAGDPQRPGDGGSRGDSPLAARDSQGGASADNACAGCGETITFPPYTTTKHDGSFCTWQCFERWQLKSPKATPSSGVDEAERLLAERDVVLKTLADTASKAEALTLRLDALRKDVLGIANSVDCGWKVYTGMAAVALEDDLRRAAGVCTCRNGQSWAGKPASGCPVHDAAGQFTSDPRGSE